MSGIESTINERINKIVEISGLKLATFARLNNIPQSTLNDCIKYGKEPRYDLLVKIYNAIPLLNLEWFMTGVGEPLNSDTSVLIQEKDKSLVEYLKEENKAKEAKIEKLIADNNYYKALLEKNNIDNKQTGTAS